MKTSVFCATSLDGFIARQNDALDRLPGDDCEPHGYDEFIASVDAIVIGARHRAGLIDRMVITRIPVLIGSGIPLFGSLPHDIRLEQMATQSFRGGLVQSEYTIVT